MARPKILFFSQGFSLAHVGRPLALAESLSPGAFVVHFARTAPMARFVASPHLVQHEVRETLAPRDFLGRLKRGQPIYDHAMLRADVAEELRLLEAVRPDFVVGDFRLSLQVSARHLGVPFALLSNAYWSPSLPLNRFPVPEHLAATLLGVPLATALFRRLYGPVFRQHVKPFNDVRRHFGLRQLGEVREAYHDADHLFFGDAPELFPETDLGGEFLGPLQWEPPCELPGWWKGLQGRDRVFVSMGSTGSARVLTEGVLAATRACGLDVMVATADRSAPPADMLTASFIPGLQAAKKSRAMVCGGSAPAMAQAMAAGIPALAVCSNLDQMLAAERLAAAGAVLTLRADRASPRAVRQGLERLLSEPRFAAAAQALAPCFTPHRATTAFANWLGRRFQTRVAA